MSKKIKRSFRVYAAWDYEKEETFINENSKNGWQLIKGGCFHSVYEKDNSKEYIYKIDYNPATIKKSDEKQLYISMFEDTGWEYINSTFNGWNYFRKEYDKNLSQNEYEIYTDNTSYKEMIENWCKVGKIAVLVELILSIIYTYIAIRERELIIGIEAILFWVIFIWINSGIKLMNKKIKKD